MKTVEQMVRLDCKIYSEIGFHECVFPEAGFEPQDLVSPPGPLLFSYPPVPGMLLRLPGGAVMPPHLIYCC